MIAKTNALPQLTLPQDGGVNAGNLVGGVEYLIMTGDVANRQEAPIQSAAASWAQFATGYLDGLTLRNNSQQQAGILLAPGNHDVSNAIGYYKTMAPLTDSTAMVNMYNLMMPAPRPAGPYNYAAERIHYSRDVGGIHLMFVCIWPDSAERIWMANDLRDVTATTPLILFTHDQPAVESKHFANPNGVHTINSTVTLCSASRWPPWSRGTARPASTRFRSMDPAWPAAPTSTGSRPVASSRRAG